MAADDVTQCSGRTSWLWRGGKLLVIGLVVVLPVIGLMMMMTESGQNASTSAAQSSLGGPKFDLSRATVKAQEIRAGGPPKDGIPALTQPKMIPIARADYLGEDDRVIGVVINGQARAYPLAILNYHEIVNDTVGDVSVAVVPTDNRLPNKERVLGVWLEDSFRAYPESRFPSRQDEVSDNIDDKRLTIAFDRGTRSMRVTSADDGVQWMYSLWFAWYALHPDTTVYGDPVTPADHR